MYVIAEAIVLPERAEEFYFSTTTLSVFNVILGLQVYTKLTCTDMHTMIDYGHADLHDLYSHVATWHIAACAELQNPN